MKAQKGGFHFTTVATVHGHIRTFCLGGDGDVGAGGAGTRKKPHLRLRRRQLFSFAPLMNYAVEFRILSNPTLENMDEKLETKSWWMRR